MRLRSSRRMLRVVLLGIFTVSSFLGARYPMAEQDTAVSEAVTGGPFQLTSHRNEQVTDATYAENHMLIYFGYTFCPDLCPLGLQTMMTAYDELLKVTQDAVTPIFVTIDPERDTVSVMADYVDLFHPDLIGLTGSSDEIAAIAKAYRVFYAKVTNNESPADYLVNHSVSTYLMGPNSNYIARFKHDSSPDEIATVIKEALGS